MSGGAGGGSSSAADCPGLAAAALEPAPRAVSRARRRLLCGRSASPSWSRMYVETDKKMSQREYYFSDKLASNVHVLNPAILAAVLPFCLDGVSAFYL
jgi:hypothetical protein